MGLFDGAKESAMKGLLDQVMQSEDVQQGIKIASDAKNALIATANRFDTRFNALEQLATAQAQATLRIEQKLNQIYDTLHSDVVPAAPDGLMQLMGEDFKVQETFDPIPVPAPDGLMQLMGDDFKVQEKFGPIVVTNVVHESETFHNSHPNDGEENKPN